TIGGSLIGGTVEIEFGGASISSAASMGPVQVGGSLMGGEGDRSARISAGQMGKVTIGGDVRGGLGAESGAVTASAIASVTVNGDLVGGPQSSTGVINGFNKLGPVVVGGDLRGGGNSDAGAILGEEIKSVTIRGSLYGGPASGTPQISGITLGPVKIFGDFVGGTNQFAGNQGAISALNIASVTCARPIYGGSGMGPSGLLTASETLGPVKIGGNLIGRALQFPVIKAGTSIASLTVGGRVENAAIFAGSAYNTGALGDPDAQIGPVRISGDWIASNLAAGVNGSNGLIGDGDDTLIGPEFPNQDTDVRSRIASIVIKGQVLGTVASGDHFGFVAEEIGFFKVGSAKVILTSGPNNDTSATSPTLLVAATGDVRVREV